MSSEGVVVRMRDIWVRLTVYEEDEEGEGAIWVSNR